MSANGDGGARRKPGRRRTRSRDTASIRAGMSRVPRAPTVERGRVTWIPLLVARARESRRRLRDLEVITTLAIEGLLARYDSLHRTARRGMEVEVVDAAGSPYVFSQRKKYLRALIEVAVEGRLFEQALGTVVFEVEQHIALLLRLFWATFPERVPRKLGQRLHARAARPDLSSSDLEEIASASARAALFKPPTDYLDIMESALGERLYPPVREAYLELKATRDVVTHAGGVADLQYERKAGSAARAQGGTRLSVDRAYFRRALQTGRQLVMAATDLASTRLSALPQP